MATVTLLAALSLDGTWRTSRADPALLLRLLAPGAGPVFTDVEAFRRKKIARLRFGTVPAILKMAWGGEPLRVLGSPRLHAALLERGWVKEIAVLRQPEIALGPVRETLSRPFVPPGAGRLLFRPLPGRTAAEGLVCRYRRAPAS